MKGIAMEQASDSMTARVAENPTRSWSTRWACSLILGLALVQVYLANPRDLSTYDTAATTMMTLTLVRGEGVYLDRFRPILLETRNQFKVFVVPWHGHMLSRYPVAPALLVLPLV